MNERAGDANLDNEECTMNVYYMSQLACTTKYSQTNSSTSPKSLVVKCF